MQGLLDGILPGWLIVFASWLPLWVWIALGCLVAGFLLRYVRIVGWQGALASAVAIISIGALGAARRGGWEDREKKGGENVKRVVEEARRARERVRVDNTDPDRLRDDDGYRRD